MTFHATVPADVLVEDAAFLAETYVGLEEAAKRLGYSGPKMLDRALRRAGRPDLTLALRAHDWLTPEQIRDGSLAAAALTQRGIPRTPHTPKEAA